MDITGRLRTAIPYLEDEEAETEPFLDRAAEWASELSYRDVPKPVQRTAKIQLTANVAAAVWTRKHPYGNRISETVGRNAGDRRDATLLSGEKTAPEAAAYGNAALSTALDFSPTILGGYIGDSSVFVPLAYAEANNTSGRQLLVSQIAANEIAGRLGAATAGTLSEDQATYVHAVSAAVGRGVVEGDDAETLADAMATALSQPPWPLERSVVGSDAGIWRASEPLRSGITAVDSARSGITGRRDLVEAGDGLLSTVSERPAPSYLSDFGERWHTRSLTVKQFPGNALVAAPIEAAIEARGRFDRGRTAVSRIDVSVPRAAIATAERADGYADGTTQQPGVLSRSVSRNVAKAIVDGGSIPEWIHGGQDGDRIRTVVERVRVEHAPELTVQAARSDGQASVSLGGNGPLAPLRAARSLGSKTTIRHFPSVLLAGRTRTPPDRTATAERRFGSHIVVTTADGRRITASVDRPAGFAGSPLAEIRAIARNNCREGLAAAGINGAKAKTSVDELLAIDESDTVSSVSVWDVLTG